MDVEKLINYITNYLVEELDPEEIILFGSRAKDSFRQGSDIDMAIKGGIKLTHRKERKLREQIDRMAKIYTVDIVFFNNLDNDFKELVENTGKVLYEKS